MAKAVAKWGADPGKHNYRILGIIRERKVSWITFFCIVSEKTFVIHKKDDLKLLSGQSNFSFAQAPERDNAMHEKAL